MAKHHHDFGAADALRIDEFEPECSRAGQTLVHGEDRQALLIRFLSQSEGFAAAARALGGSFGGPASAKGAKRN